MWNIQTKRIDYLFTLLAKWWQSALNIILMTFHQNTSSLIDPNDKDDDTHHYWRLITWQIIMTSFFRIFSNPSMTLLSLSMLTVLHWRLTVFSNDFFRFWAKTQQQSCLTVKTSLVPWQKSDSGKQNVWTWSRSMNRWKQQQPKRWHQSWILRTGDQKIQNFFS